MFEGIGFAIFYGFILAFAIGPIFFLLIETSITKGFRCALTFDLGAITSDILFIILAYYSTNIILERVKDDPNILIFGGIIIVSYGVISFIKMATFKSVRKVVREHYDLGGRKNLLGLFFKGFLLNFINFGVLAGWIGTIIMANAFTSSEEGVVVFLVAVVISLFVTDILKIYLAKKLKDKMTPRMIIKVKKWSSILIVCFGLFVIYQGFYPKKTQALQNTFETIKEKLPN